MAVAAAAAALAVDLPAGAVGDDASRNLVLQAAAPAARKEQRLALVIGNSAYKEAPLANPVNDARAMANALESTGFTVLLQTDVDHRALLAAVRDFGNRLRQGGVGVFYYAGHGMQIKGRNYLIPIGADIQREDEVAYAALDAQAVLDKMEAAANGTNLMILDACRNNPFARSFRSSVQGLAQMEAPVGTLVAFSTAPGSVASDGQGTNGLYTQHLLTAMRTPGAKVEDVFKQVRAGVRRDSQGKQIPWESTSLEGDLYFTEPVAPAPAPKPDTAKASEEAFWDVVKDSRDAAELRAYLSRYPQGQFADAARTRLTALAPPPVPPAPVTTAPAVAAPSPVAQPVAVPVAKPPAMPPPTIVAIATPVAAPTTPVVPAPPAPLPSAPAQPQMQSLPASTHSGNALGYTVGDTWKYQTIDKRRGEVVGRNTVKVAAIRPDGSWIATAGTEYDELGRSMKWVTASGELRQAVPFAAGAWWPDMRVGEKRRFQYEVTGVPTAGDRWTDRVDSEARVIGIETVKVPAGEFQAYHVELKGTSTAVGRYGAGSFTASFWYAPELHTWVAYEQESIWNGRADLRERKELTALSLVNHPNLAAIAVSGAETATSSPVAQTPRPPQELLPPGPPGNAQGYAVGEKWKFQVVDKYKGEVVRNLERRVLRVDAGGVAVMTGDDGYVEPWYRFLRTMLDPAWADHRSVWWEDMKPGDNRQVAFKAGKLGASLPADVAVRIVHKGFEKIRVPAGEFEATLLNCSGTTYWMASSGYPVTDHWELNVWYVSALHFYAATELASHTINMARGNSTAGEHERMEMTSFELHNGPLASR